jgi:uncharacterized protein (DUF488 family)
VAATFYTIGHSRHPVDEFVGLLTGAGVRFVADVRTVPRSRTNPQFNKETLPGALAPNGIGYEHIAALGGLRGKARGVPPTLNGLWTNGSFHNYADYALGEPFQSGLAHLIDIGHRTPTAVMCAEAVWWRCHRRIVADYLISLGEDVFHIMGEGRLGPARLTPGAIVRDDGTINYPAAETDPP